MNQVELKTCKTGFRSRAERSLFKCVGYLVRRDSLLSPYILSLLSLLLPLYRQKKLVPIAWLDENKVGFVREICPETQTVSYGPSIDGLECIENVTAAAVNLYSFKYAVVSADSSSIFVSGKAIVERAKGTETERSDYSSGQIVVHGIRSALVRDKFGSHLENGFFLGGNGSSNYYHWMMEILVKLELLEQLSEFDKIPLLVNEGNAETKNLMDALALLAPDRQVVLMGKHDSYLVETLVYINAPNSCPYNLRKNFEIRIRDFAFRESTIKFLRQSLLGELTDGHKAATERIFMARRGTRRGYNQEEIFEILARYGFRKVFMEEMSLREQIELVSKSEMIVGPTGAAWTNLVFCQPGTKCLCWMAVESSGFSGYSNIAKIVGADLRYLTYKTGAKSTRELYSTDYHLDKEKFQRALSQLFI